MENTTVSEDNQQQEEWFVAWERDFDLIGNNEPRERDQPPGRGPDDGEDL